MSLGIDEIKLALPKGHMQEGVQNLLLDAGIRVEMGRRSYRPSISLAGVNTKILKPQNIVEMLRVGSRDIGFAGSDWVEELGAKDQLVELLDTELDPVRLVAAAPTALLEDGKLPNRPLVIASEYEQIARSWIARKGLDATFVRSYGATEVFPPEDADCIVDNTATGSTLQVNRLEIVDTLLQSSTRLYAHPHVMDQPAKRERVESLVLVLKSVLDARRRVVIELNVTADHLEGIVAILPCMRHPTISPLYGEAGFAVKAAVPRADLPTLIPAIKAAGGSDVVVTRLMQVVA
jgi:ATP phosphoribosyltransferase